MKLTDNITRREFLRSAGMGSLMLLASITVPSRIFSQNSLTEKKTPEPDIEIALRSVEKSIPILPGRSTPVWSYEGDVLKGDGGTLQNIKNSYLGPIIRVQKGQRVRIHYTNYINEPSIIHWHGLQLPANMDGHPIYVIPKGKTYVYDFEVKNRAGTYWYHPHPHRRTGPQVYFGLAGMFIVSDKEEGSAGLPSGDFDIPIVLQDRSFDEQNQLVYLPFGRMDQMIGFLGNQILVNGKIGYTLHVPGCPHRLRILNGSNSRIYKLAWSTYEPITVIGTDGGLLEKPLDLPYLVLGPGERADVWADFSKIPKDTDIELLSLSFSGVSSIPMNEMMRRMHGRSMMRGTIESRFQPIPHGSEFIVMKFQVLQKKGNAPALPKKLSHIDRFSPSEAGNSQNPRRFIFAMESMSPTINGRVFELEGTTQGEIVCSNSTEVWELVNSTRGMGMMGMNQLPHPVHIHGVQFQIVNRSITESRSPSWESLRDGSVDEGWKDTVLVLPGMEVKILLKFGNYPGLFLYHCHNLEHEDMGMMRNYLVDQC